tara:strand:+ start:1268 stop:1684 length:417 start_codon:yes stop_codon:yes gene_type:complete
MDKTTKLAKPRSINKRGQRRDIYNNENGEVLGDTTNSERDKRIANTNDVDLASRETMRYYFDNEWFDNDRYYTDYKKTKSFVSSLRNRGDAITPQRCVECKRPFQKIIPTPHKGTFAYLNSELFGNMPLEDGVCGNCE